MGLQAGCAGLQGGGGLDLVERITEQLLPLAQPPLVRLLEHVLEDILLALGLVLSLAHLLHARAVAHVARLEGIEGVVVLAELLLVRTDALLELGLVRLVRVRVFGFGFGSGFGFGFGLGE